MVKCTLIDDHTINKIKGLKMWLQVQRVKQWILSEKVAMDEWCHYQPL